MAHGSSRDKIDKRVVLTFGIALLLGLTGTALGALDASSPFWPALGTGLLVEIAAIMTGAMLGFLFGIPRSQPIEPPIGSAVIENNQASPRYIANTNLEQISDWLTKIIIGVGLVELSRIGSWFNDVFSNVSAQMGSSIALVGSLIVYSISVGFISGFLITRTRLTLTLSHYDQLMSRVDSAEEVAKEAGEVAKEAGEVAKEVAQESNDIRALAAATAVLAGEADAADDDTLLALFMNASSPVLAQIFNRAARNRRLNRNRNKEVMARSIPILTALTRRYDPPQFHRNFGQLGYALKDQSQPDWRAAEEALTTAITVRDREGIDGYRLYELNRAICRIARAPTAGETSEPLRQQIRKDLTEAIMDPLVAHWRVLDDDRIAGWLDRNGLNAKDIDTNQD